MVKFGIIAGWLMTLLVFFSGCLPGGEGEGEPAQFDWTIIIFLVIIFGLFYLLMIRPQRKKQKEMQTMVQELQKGDRVITAGGIYGQIESLSEDSIVLKIESGATIRVARSSVVGRRDKDKM